MLTWETQAGSETADAISAAYTRKRITYLLFLASRYGTSGNRAVAADSRYIS
jgi:hypothetical protein